MSILAAVFLELLKDPVTTTVICKVLWIFSPDRNWYLRVNVISTSAYFFSYIYFGSVCLLAATVATWIHALFQECWPCFPQLPGAADFLGEQTYAYGCSNWMKLQNFPSVASCEQWSSNGRKSFYNENVFLILPKSICFLVVLFYFEVRV